MGSEMCIRDSYLSCGFREEGRLEKELWRDGAYRDVLILSRFADA